MRPQVLFTAALAAGLLGAWQHSMVFTLACYFTLISFYMIARER